MRAKSRSLKFLLLLWVVAVCIVLFWIAVGRNDQFPRLTTTLFFEYDFSPATNYSGLQDLEMEMPDAFDEWMAMAPEPVIHIQDMIKQNEEKLNAVTDYNSNNMDIRNCQMSTCFNFKKCQNDLKVYVYPTDKFVPISSTYEKILNRVISSTYYTSDPEEACLFILSIDTLDRDALSHDFVRNLGSRVNSLQVRL